MRTSSKIAIASSVLFLLGTFLACSSSDSPGGGFSGAGNAAGSSGSAGKAGGGGNAGNKPDGGGGTGNIIIPTEAGDQSTPEDACAATSVKATLKPAYLLLLIDRSGSMNCNAPPTQTTAECNASPKKKDASQPSKWEITREALKEALNDLKATIPVPSVGIGLFNNDGYCGFPATPDVAVAELNDAQIGAIVPVLDAVVPKGDTPIVGSMMSAFAYLQQQQVTGNKFVVLLTDGAETCDKGSLDFLVTKANEATWIGIRSFALGAPGSEEGRSFLSRIAFNGGTAADPNCDHTSSDPTVGNCHIDMTQPGTVFKDELKKALAKVSGAALTCEIDVPTDDGGKADPDKVNVVFTDGDGKATTIVKDDTKPCDQTNTGWQYTDGNKTKIVVCGPTCDTIKGDPKGSLSVQLGCETVVPK
ncbi:MAG: VWA domain-containing protein [Deltaproteobacteria bacterium]|nr:VWA domain-containing protein [Deltaproteobacteria bacterium]